jgi:ferrous iron transport protein B
MSVVSEIILAGNPNCGKSSLFNLLTGLNQKTSNVPGTTVEVRKAKYKKSNGSNIDIIDLPGAYSINPFSEDEKEAIDFLTLKLRQKSDSLVVYVADASNLKRNLLFFSQIASFGCPMMLVLTMNDVADKKGISIDIERLQLELGVPVIALNPKVGDKEKISALKKTIEGEGFSSHYPFPIEFEANKNENAIRRFEAIEDLIKKVQTKTPTSARLTEKLDKILLHPLWGMLFFIFTLLVIFQAVFYLADFPMSLIESIFSWLTIKANTLLPQGFFADIVSDGILPGLAGVLIFLPQIIILFFLLTCLEDSGYMARITYLMDWPMRKFGLSGKSVLPLISGAACAIPAILSARSIENRKERLITILVTPFISCSARLPVYVLLAGLIVPDHAGWYLFNIRGLLLLAMYLLGFITSLLVAGLISYFLKKQEKGIFLMELPVYHTPNLKNVWRVCLSKSKSFVNEAGKIILIVSIGLWFLASHGYGEKWEAAQVKYVMADNSNRAEANSEKLKTSYAGELGHFIEPVIKPLGYDWKIGIALITSFAAREVFVGTLSTIYGLQDESDFRGIRAKMASEKDPITGKPIYSAAVALSLMLFYAFAMQCMSTVAVVYKETRSIKWPIIQFVFMTALAYLAAMLAYMWLK